MKNNEQVAYDELDAETLVKHFKQRAKIDYDAVVAITGEEGSSKSTLATQCVLQGLLYEGHSREEAASLIGTYTIFSPNKERVKEQITQAPRYSIINADEAIKILYKLNWNTDIQKFLNMLYALCRKENKITLLCMPRFTDFNEYFRKHRIKFWIHIIDRGMGVLFAKDWNPFTDDPWWMKEGMDIVKNNYGRRKVSDFTTEDKLKILSKVRNFVAIVRFDDLDPDIKKVYKEGKETFGYEDMGEESANIGDGKRAEMYVERLKATVKNLKEKGYDKKQIATITATPLKTICNYVKEIESKPMQLLSNNKQKKEDKSD